MLIIVMKYAFSDAKKTAILTAYDLKHRTTEPAPEI